MKKIFIAALLTLTLPACGHKDEQAPQVSNILLAPPSPAHYSPAARDGSVDENGVIKGNSVTDTAKKLIKDGEIDFETQNIDNTRKRISRTLIKLGGYIEGENETNIADDHQNKLVLRLRVPYKNFDILLDSIASGTDKIDAKIITIKDVTTQFIDIKADLNNKKLLETRYLELLKKADKISDMLQIENKLTEIRTAIDSTQGQLNYLSKQVAYSTLTVNFYTKIERTDTGEGIGYRFKSALSTGWKWLQDLFFGLIGSWPLIIIITTVVVLIKRWWKRRKARKSQS